MDIPPPTIALPPVPHLRPIIQDAARNQAIQVLGEDGTETTELAYLIWDSPNVERAYQKWPTYGRPSRILEGRGKIVWANVLLRDRGRTDGRLIFRRSERTVAIKQLRRRAIEPPRQGGEDPYAEISVMQAYPRGYGDDRHVRCCEALRDVNHLYIVTLQARDGDVFDQIRWGLGGGFAPRDQVPRVARQLVKNLEYLQLHKLVHRDLKPENVLVEEYPWLPIIDCAMTLKIPYLEGRPQKIVPQGVAGSRCYISPEVLLNQHFDHKADVWAVGVCLLYTSPSPRDGLLSRMPSSA